MNTNIRKTVIAAASLAASLASAPALATTPAGYTPIAYIQGNGVDARIITDYIPHPQTDKIEAEIEWPEGKIDGNQGVWCARGDDGTDKTYTLFAIGSNLRFDYNKTRGDLLAPALAKDVKYTVTADRYEFTWSGGNGQTHTEDTGFLQAGNPLVLFATYAKGIDSEVGNYGKFRLYSFKVWRSGELIHDFVPCRDANRVATVIDICDNPATLTVEGTFFAPGALPTGYTPVTYIQGNGVDARIITDYIPNPQTDKVEAVVEWPEGKIDGNQGVWCARGTTTTDNTWTLHMLGNSGSKLRFDYKSTSGDLFEPAVSTDVKYTVTVDRYIATWSGGNGHTHTADPNFTAAGNNLVLFGVYSGATVDAYTGNYGKFRLYSFKVWQSGELIHDFVPCKDASGVATMVDICDNPATLTVEGTFFTPGDKGRLPAGYVELEYIQGGNKTRIITDYVPHPQTDKVEAVVEWPSSVSGALSGNQGVWCARGTTTTDNTWTLHMLGEQGSKLRFDYKTTSGNLFDPAVSTDVKYTVTVDRYIATWSGGNGHTHTADPNFTAAGNKLVLFGVYSGATIDTNPGNYGKHRLYSFKVWRSRKLIHYFVPCKDRNNVVTMYDICDNPAGLSVQNTFTAGPEGHYYDDSLFRHSGFVYIVR